MPNEIPLRTASLDDDGFQKLLAQAKADPAFAKAAADALERDTRGTLIKLFRLSPSQTAAIANTSDLVLYNRASDLITRLRSGDLGGATYDPGPLPAQAGGPAPIPGAGPGGAGPTPVVNPDLSCECHIKFST